MTWSDRKYGVGTSTFTHLRNIRKWSAENHNFRLVLFVDDSCYVVVIKQLYNLRSSVKCGCLEWN